MASLTAIELGADTCALARTAVGRGEVRVFAAAAVDPAAFPGDDSFTVAVRQLRKSMKLPRRARVVLWGLPEGSNPKDAAVKPLLAPLSNAGFRVESVVSPCTALAALARVRAPRGEGAICWLAVNRGGVALIVARPGKLLYQHSFVWDSNIGSSGSQARLLQRYSLVSFLSPEIKRAMAEALKHEAPVTGIVTCGNLPDLRSLTMPLIEELDVEVETLDSLDGLVVAPPASEKLLESAPAIRLACAGAIARGTRPWSESQRRSVHRTAALLRAAAVLALIGTAGYAWYRLRDSGPAAAAQLPAAGSRPPASGSPLPASSPQLPKPAVPPPAPPEKGVRPGSDPFSGATTAAKPGVSAPLPASDPGRQIAAPPIQAAPNPPVPVPQPGSAPAVQHQSAPDEKGVRPGSDPFSGGRAAPDGRGQAKPAVPTGIPVGQSATRIPTVPATQPVPPATPQSVPVARPQVNPGSPRADNPSAGTGTGSASTSAAAPMPALLKDAVPRITAILVANDRRFATVEGGQIVGVGDVLGRRVVVGIEEKAVLLREPSGTVVRVGLGGRVLGVDRGR